MTLSDIQCLLAKSSVDACRGRSGRCLIDYGLRGLDLACQSAKIGLEVNQSGNNSA